MVDDERCGTCRCQSVVAEARFKVTCQREGYCRCHASDMTQRSPRSIVVVVIRRLTLSALLPTWTTRILAVLVLLRPVWVMAAVVVRVLRCSVPTTRSPLVLPFCVSTHPFADLPRVTRPAIRVIRLHGVGGVSRGERVCETCETCYRWCTVAVTADLLLLSQTPRMPCCPLYSAVPYRYATLPPKGARQ